MITKHRIKEVLDYLIPIFEKTRNQEVVKELLLLKHRYNQCEKNKREGIITEEIRNVEINKLCKAILTILSNHDETYFVENNFKSFLGIVVMAILIVAVTGVLIYKFLDEDYGSVFYLFLAEAFILLIVSSVLFVLDKFNELYSIFIDIWLGLVCFLFLLPLFFNWFDRTDIIHSNEIVLILVTGVLLLSFLIKKSINKIDKKIYNRGLQKSVVILLSLGIFIIVLDSQFLIKDLLELLHIEKSDNLLVDSSNFISSYYSTTPREIKEILYPTFLSFYFMFFILSHLVNKKIYE